MDYTFDRRYDTAAEDRWIISRGSGLDVPIWHPKDENERLLMLHGEESVNHFKKGFTLLCYPYSGFIVPDRISDKRQRYDNYLPF